MTKKLCKYIRCEEKKRTNCMILPMNTITNHCAVLENIYGKYSFTLRIRQQFIFLNLNRTLLLRLTKHRRVRIHHVPF